MSYAENVVELLDQLEKEGYSPHEKEKLRTAYLLALTALNNIIRQSGTLFISHVVRIASIGIQHQFPFSLTVAALLHPIYAHGPFPSRNRQWIRDTFNEHIEMLLFRYTSFPWTPKAIAIHADALHSYNAITRDVLLIRITNELEDYLDEAVLFQSQAPARLKTIQSVGPHLIAMAEALGYPALAAECHKAFSSAGATTIPEALRGSSERCSFTIPLSYRRTLSHTLKYYWQYFLEKLWKIKRRLIP